MVVLNNPPTSACATTSVAASVALIPYCDTAVAGRVDDA